MPPPGNRAGRTPMSTSPCEFAPDRTKEVVIHTGLTADGKVEVSGDLKEGDRVVVNSAA